MPSLRDKYLATVINIRRPSRLDIEAVQRVIEQALVQSDGDHRPPFVFF
jgi:hypothetical protein